MGQHFSDEDATGPVVDSRDQPILVSFDVGPACKTTSSTRRKRLGGSCCLTCFSQSTGSTTLSPAHCLSKPCFGRVPTPSRRSLSPWPIEQIPEHSSPGHRRSDSPPHTMPGRPYALPARTPVSRSLGRPPLNRVASPHCSDLAPPTAD